MENGEEGDGLKFSLNNSLSKQVEGKWECWG